MNDDWYVVADVSEDVNTVCCMSDREMSVHQYVLVHVHGDVLQS